MIFPPGTPVVEPRRGGGSGIGCSGSRVVCGERGLAPTFRTQHTSEEQLAPRSSQQLQASQPTTGPSLATSSSAWACSCLDQPSHNAPGAQLFLGWIVCHITSCLSVVVVFCSSLCSHPSLPPLQHHHHQLPAGRCSNNSPTHLTYTAPRLPATLKLKASKPERSRA